MTEAQFYGYIKGALRKVSMYWKPAKEATDAARVSRGVYECAACSKHVPASVKATTGKKAGKRVRNFHVDHIEPVIDPEKGFVGWDDLIERMFCEVDGFQILCGDCHAEKTAAENAIALARKRREKAEAKNA